VDPSRAMIVPRLLVADPAHSWPRLFLTVLHHTSEAHIYYNVLSLLWKGVRLEDRWGTRRMVVTSLALTFASHCFMVALSWLLYQFDATRGWSDYNAGALGMSALLFAFKVIVHADPALEGSHEAVAGGLFSVPLRWAAWAELLFIQLLIPNVSLLGHLGGILAGLAYVKLVRPYHPDEDAAWAAAAAAGFWGGGGGGAAGDQPGAPARPGTAMLLSLLAPLRWIGQALSGNLHAPGADGQPPRRRFNHDPQGYALGRRADDGAAAAGLRRRGAGAGAAGAGAGAGAFSGAGYNFPAVPPSALHNAEGEGADPDVQLSGPRPSAPPMSSDAAAASASPPVSTAGATSTAEGQPADQVEGSASLSSGPPYYEAQMKTLYAMGFHDRRANLVALRATRGDIDASIAALV